MQHKAQGFTLIELLVVIAIIAVLAVVVILTLNPAQLLAQARDSNRISDMSTLKSVISLYLADVNPINMYVVTSTVGTSTCWVSAAPAVVAVTQGCARYVLTPASVPPAAVVASTTAANANKVNNQGWIPIDFTAISSGSPIGSLPVDPTNNSIYFYSYATTGAPAYQFEIDTVMESTKYGNGGSGHVMDVDGGDQAAVYEAGTNLKL